MHTKRKPLWWEDKDIEPQGDPRKSQKSLQPWQWKIKWSRCRHSQFCGNTTSGLCECCCPSLCLIPAGAWLSWCLEGASFSSCLPPPFWGLPIYWNRAPRVTGVRNMGTAMGKGTVSPWKEEGVGLYQAMSTVTQAREQGKLREEAQK